MKKLILIIIAMFGLNVAFGQLNPGDIAFVQYNADSVDNFAFVALVDIPASEVIKFTDNEENDLGGGEGTITWTPPAGGISCGTVVEITNDPAVSAGHGSVTQTNNLNFATSGDGIIAYQGTTGSPIYITALGNDGSSAGTYSGSKEGNLPSGLTLGVNAQSIAEIDNAKYDGSLLNDTSSNLSAAIYDASNWNGSDSSNQTFSGTFTVTDCSSNATDSDAVAPTTQIAGTTINSTVTTSGAAVEVFKIEIQDSGDGDTLDTKVTSLKLKPAGSNSADWTDTIQGLVFDFSGTIITPSSAINITDGFIEATFNSGDIIVPDGDSRYLTIKAYLNTSNIVDQSTLSFKVDAADHGFTADSAGSTFKTAFPNDIISNDFTVEVDATELQITQQPTDVLVQFVMAPAVTVAYTDANGNVDIDNSSTATLSATNATLSGDTTTAGTPVQGIMTFDDIAFDTTGTGVTLTITDDNDGTINKTSNTFNVTEIQDCENVFISEYVQTNTKHYLEIYNPSGLPIDMSNYQIWRGTDGGSWTTATVIPLGDSGIPALDVILSGHVYVIGKSTSEIPFANKFDTNMDFDGNDNIGLAWNGGSGTNFVLIDAIGDDQGNPGTGWDVAGITDATHNGRLVRNPTFGKGNTNWTTSAGTDASDSEWLIPASYIQTQYYHVANCIQTPIMGVAGNGFNPIYDENAVGQQTPNATNGTIFEAQEVGLTTVDHIFLIGNVGNTDLNLTGNPIVQISGVNASDFTVVSPPSTPVNGGNNTKPFTITFNPTGGGVRTAMVTIANDDNLFPGDYTFRIQGTGLLDHVPCNIATGATIYLQDFETAGGYTTSETEFTDNDSDYFIRTDGSNINQTYTDPIGSYYFAAMDLDGNGSVTFPLTLSIDNIDISNTTNLILKVYLAEDPGFGWDNADYVHINYDIDSNGFSNGIWVENDGTGSNKRAEIDTDFDGTGDGTELTSTFTQFSTNIVGTGDLLDLVIEFNLNSGDEDIAIDHIEIIGDTFESTTWNGTAWSNNAPTNTVKAIFDANYDTANGNIETCACKVNGTATVTVNAGEHLLVETDFENNGIVDVKNEGSIVQHKRDAVLSGSGEYKIEKTTPTYALYDYIYWSSPLNGETIGSVFAANEASRIYSFNTANFLDEHNGGYPQTLGSSDTFDDNGDDWEVVSGATVMKVGMGYIAMGEGSIFPINNPLDTGTTTQTVVFDDGIINNGDLIVSVVKDKYNTDGLTGSDSANTNANLIGNPYPSAIDIRMLNTQVFDSSANLNGVLEGTFYFWTHDTAISSATSGPDAYNFTNDDYSIIAVPFSGTPSIAAAGNNTGSSASYFVSSGQGFFADAHKNGDITFTNKMRLVNNNNTFRNYTQTTNNVDRIWLNLTKNDSNIFRQIMVGFEDLATDGFVNGQDAARMENGSNTDFYSIIHGDTKHYAIQNLSTFNTSKTVALGLEIIEDGTYEINIDHVVGVFAEDQIVYLQDNETDTIWDLTNNGAYKFVATVGDNINNRFVLRFTTTALGITDNSVTTQIIVAQNEQGFNLSTSDKTAIKSASVFNTIGQQLGYYNANNGEIQIPTTNINQGTILFISVTLDNGSRLTKKVVKL